MIKYAVKLSSQAEKDLELIAKKVKPANAAAFASLESHVLGLENMPERYPFYEEEPWVSKGLRFMKTSGFGIFFGINKEKKIVYVVRILMMM